MILHIFVIFLATNYYAHSARILGVFPTPAYSHQAMARPIMLELQARGHEIVTITTAPLNEKAPPNYKEIDISFLHDHMNATEFTLDAMKRYRILFFYSFQKKIEKLIEAMYTMDDVQQLINSEQHFDLLILEWSAHASLTAFSERFNCPMIGIRSLNLRVEAHDVVGNPVSPSYIPVVYQEYQDFYWRLINTIIVLYVRLLHRFLLLPSAEHIANRIFPNHSTYVGHLEQKVSLMLVNTHPVFTGSRPLVPSVIEVGGIPLLNVKSMEIPQDIKEYLDGAKEGAILFSLGTILSLKDIVNEEDDIIMEVLSDLPYRIICKADGIESNIGSENIRKFNWLPQVAILNHPNIRLFITHAGMQSVWESAISGVPIIGLPFTFDQFHNARRMKELGAGLYMDYNSLTKKTLTKFINEIMTNSSYKERAVQLGKLLKDQPMAPLDKAMWWIEYVLRNGGTPHFRTDAVGMPWYIYYSLDVIIFLMVMSLMIIIIIFKIMKLLFMFYKKCKDPKMKKN